jgi:hypothetical protein
MIATIQTVVGPKSLCFLVDISFFWTAPSDL